MVVGMCIHSQDKVQHQFDAHTHTLKLKRKGGILKSKKVLHLKLAFAKHFQQDEGATKCNISQHSGSVLFINTLNNVHTPIL